AYFYIRDGGTAIDYQIIAHEITNVTAAHIHDGNAGENGPVLVPLYTAPAGTTVNPNGVLVTGTIEPADLPEEMTIAALANLMLDGELYVNVHTTAHPDGEIRGQTQPLGDAVFHASLDGSNELPPTNSDASGEAVFLYDAEDGVVEFQLALADITGMTAAHIHRGQSNVNGPVLVLLDDVPNPSPQGAFTGVISGVFTEAELEGLGIEELVYLMATGNAYVNVHTLENPDGEIRGQIDTGAGLIAEDDAVWFTTLHGGNENPVVDTEASGYLITESDAAGVLTYTLIVAQIDNATAAHLHLGALGENGDVIATLFTKSATTPGLENGILAEGQITPDMSNYGLVVYALLTGNAYVNVHSTIEPDGEIRGQLTPELGPVVLARLDGVQQIPVTPEEPVVTDATGVAVFWGDEDEELLRYAIVIDDLENPIAAHLHHGRAGRSGPIVATLFSAPENTV
ncbi:MAG: CHRD domain-containing protein, partial [Vicinamibacterales bacterium]